MKTFNTKKVDWMKQPMFFGEEPNTQRFDQQKYPIFEKLKSTTIRILLATRRSIFTKR